MEITEFSNMFDTLLNSYSQKASFGDTYNKAELVLNEYEKSVFLTKAQEELVLELYNGKNIYGDSFEKTEELRRYLSALVVTELLNPIAYVGALSKYSKFYKLNDNLLFLTYEAFLTKDNEDNCDNGKTLEVLPVSQDDFHRIVNNPFRGVSSRRALRLDVGSNIVEIVSKYNGTYQVRYLRKPNPIILESLEEQGLSINGESEMSESIELHEALHQKILDRAVRLALISRGYNLNNVNK